jgi:hypothetical protein
MGLPRGYWRAAREPTLSPHQQHQKTMQTVYIEVEKVNLWWGNCQGEKPLRSFSGKSRVMNQVNLNNYFSFMGKTDLSGAQREMLVCLHNRPEERSNAGNILPAVPRGQ